jgi:hypothetical protein
VAELTPSLNFPTVEDARSVVEFADPMTRSFTPRAQVVTAERRRSMIRDGTTLSSMASIVPVMDSRRC